jgi:hypothetical protein
MNIVRHVLISLAAATTVVGAALVGCGTTNNINTGGGTSGIGEACTRTFDCKSGLVCLSNQCFPAQTTEGDGGVSDGGEGGTSIITGPHLGLMNAACQTSLDCQPPLECIASGSVTLCKPVNYGLAVTGKSCVGECNAPADCCELPVGTSVSAYGYYSWGADGGVDISTYHAGPGYLSSVRCEDLTNYLAMGGGPSQCDLHQTYDNTYQSYLANVCVLYKQYCQCAPNTWACNNNQCSYTGGCAAPGVFETSFLRCPTYTRTNNVLSTTCNGADAGVLGSCAPSTCATNDDCAGKIPSGGSRTCSSNDAGTGTNCVCNQSACYFACAKDIDCPGGYSCDAASHLCKKTDCASDTECVYSMNDPRAKCVAGTCSLSCTRDVECGGSSSNICSGGFCKLSGCSSDHDCSSTQHKLCVTTPPATQFVGAVTN